MCAHAHAHAHAAVPVCLPMRMHMSMCMCMSHVHTGGPIYQQGRTYTHIYTHALGRACMGNMCMPMPMHMSMRMRMRRRTYIPLQEDLYMCICMHDLHG